MRQTSPRRSIICSYPTASALPSLQSVEGNSARCAPAFDTDAILMMRPSPI
jgi:hypothetical protein